MRLFLSKEEIIILRNLACDRLCEVEKLPAEEPPMKQEGAAVLYDAYGTFKSLIDKLDRYRK